VTSIENIFWNDHQARPRAGWRLAIQLAINVGLIALLTWPLGIKLDSPLTSKYPSLKMAISALRLIATAVSLWLAARFLDRRRMADFGLHFSASWWADLGFGLALGGLLASGTFLIGLMAGWVTIAATFQSGIAGVAFPIAILLPFVQYVCLGTYEELLSRGYHLKNLSEGLNAPILGPKGAIVLAALLSAAFFALLHAGNQGATAISMLSVLAAGIVQSLGYLLTGEIAIPIGYHIAFNFFAGSVFGVSAQGDATTFIAIQYSDQMTSASLNAPGGGLLGIGMSVAAALLILGWVRWRHGEIRLREELATADLSSGKKTSEV